jgi:hypothetical protein
MFTSTGSRHKYKTILLTLSWSMLAKKKQAMRSLSACVKTFLAFFQERPVMFDIAEEGCLICLVKVVQPNEFDRLS